MQLVWERKVSVLVDKVNKFIIYKDSRVMLSYLKIDEYFWVIEGLSWEIR